MIKSFNLVKIYIIMVDKFIMVIITTCLEFIKQEPFQTISLVIIVIRLRTLTHIIYTHHPLPLNLS